MIFIGPNTIRTGNPGILPTLGNIFQASYRFLDSYLLSVRYGIDRNQFFDYQPHIIQTDSTVRQLFNTQNIDKSQSITTTFSLPFKITSWWHSQTQVMAVWQQSKTQYGNSYLSFSQWYGQVNTTNYFKIWPAGAAEITAFYHTPSQSMGIFRRPAYGSLILGLQHAINPKSTVRVSITDVLWTNKRIGRYALASEGIESSSAVIYEPRVVRLSYNHNFGSNKIKTGLKRKTGSEEERERAN